MKSTSVWNQAHKLAHKQMQLLEPLINKQANYAISSLASYFHQQSSLSSSTVKPMISSRSTNFIQTQIESPTHIQYRFFSKFLSKSATKRLPLTTKRAGKGYYKGNGCRSEGRHTSKGKFIMDRSKMLELIVPDLTDFKVNSQQP